MIDALRRTPYDREILALALPALGALAADPLVSLVDTAFVGRLGAEPLGALGVASAVFGVAFALFNFLAYGTTPMIANRLGRGDAAGAGRIAVSGLWLAVAIGAVSTAVLVTFADPILRVMGAGPDILDDARTYLSIRAFALPAVLLITVGHGVYRGHHDTRTPLVVTLAFDAVNLVLDPVFIFGLDMGVAGAAWATLIAQWLGAAGFMALMLGRHRRRLHIASATPRRDEVLPLMRAGRALVIRVASLLTALTFSVAVAARIGTVPVAAHQVAMQLWIFLALVVDALAIAGQAMVGRYLAEAGPLEASKAARRLLGLGFLAGVALAVVLAAGSPWLPRVFTDDPAVVDAVRSVYPFIVLMQPLNALVFVWDGLAIGAEAFGFLAATTAGAALVAVVLSGLVLAFGWGLVGVWWALVALMLVRAAGLAWWQARGPLSRRSAAAA